MHLDAPAVSVAHDQAHPGGLEPFEPLDLAIADHTEAGLVQRVRSLQIAQAYARLRSSSLWSLAIVGIFLGAVLPFYPTSGVIAWLAVLTGVQALRLALSHAFTTRAKPDRHDPWGTAFTVGATVAGAAWAFGPVWMLGDAGGAEGALLVIIVLCVTAVAVGQLAAWWPALLGFLSAALLPIAITLALQPGDLPGVVAAALVAGWLMQLATGRASNRTTEELIRTHLQLASSLASARQSAEALAELARRQQIDSRRLHSVVEATEAGTAEWDRSVDQIQVNARLARMLGHDSGLGPMAPSAFLAMLHPKDRALLMQAMGDDAARIEGDDHSAADRSRPQLELRLAHQAGHWIWVLAKVLVLGRPSDGVPALVSITCLDITQRKLEAKRWQTRAELSADWFWEADADMKVSHISRGVRTGLPIPNSLLIGRTLAEVEVLRPVGAGWSALADKLSRAQPFNGFICSIRSEPGDLRFVELDGRARFDAHGRFAGYEGVGRDVTEKVRATEQLKESLALVDALFESIPVPVILKGVDGEAVRSNRAYDDVFGPVATPDTGELATTRPADFAASELHRKVDLALLSQPGRQRYEVRQKLGSGRTIDALIHKATVLGANGAVRGLVGTVIDISDQKAAALALRQAKEAAEQANQAKSFFLATMSHELRTPLNAVIGAAQLLRTADSDPAARLPFIEAIEKSGSSLLGLIENIMDLSRIEAGALQLARESFDLVEAVESAVATAAVPARHKGVALVCIVEPTLEARRVGDPLRLRQLVLNLLGNAVKFTAVGEVVVRLSAQRVGGLPGVRIDVTDTGVGIADEALPHIFERFRQAEQGTNRRFGGSGLGLAIVHELVHAMEGEVAVTSQVDTGTRFVIDLPLIPDLDTLAQPVPPSRLVGEAVAFYEPHEASAEALGSLLTRLGCRHQRCADADGLRRWLQADGAHSWLLCAVDAPDTDSLLEAAVDLIDPARVVGLTLSHSHADEAARDSVGLRRTILKPVLRSTLVSRMAQAGTLEPARGRPCALAAPMASVPDTARGPIHVLLVEDDPTNRTIVGAMLESDGYRVSIAVDGQGAIDFLLSARVDLVLMDWQMPDMDGLEVTRRLRAGKSGDAAQAVPIIALTANAFAEDRAACIAAGMNDFLTKPVQIDKLLSTVRRWVVQPVTRHVHVAVPELAQG